MNVGYIKLYRKITNSFVWTNSDMFKLWRLCLMKASHEGRKILFNGQEIELNSGEFVTGRDAITKELNEGVNIAHQVNSGTAWRWLKKFEKEQMLNIKSTTKYSIISIINWNDYQSNEHQVNNERTTDEQQVNTNKNYKNYKNEKNNKTSSSKRKERIYDIDSIYYQLAEKLFKQIYQNQEIKEPNLNRWADDIRKTIEIDKRTERQVSNMIDWATTDPFWSSVVLSAKKLREKYETMRGQANRKKTSSLSKPKGRVEPLPDHIKQPPKEVPLTPEKEAEIDRKLQEYLSKE